MKNLTISITILCLFLIAKTNQAQETKEKKLVSGNSLNIAIPQGDFVSTYDHGVGVYANFDYNFNKFLSARFDLGWNDFSGPETIYIDTLGITHTNHPNMSIWEFTAGLRAKVSIFYIEARGGYFTGANAWGVVPAVGIKLGRFDAQGNLTIAGDYHWSSIRLGYYWGK